MTFIQKLEAKLEAWIFCHMMAQDNAKWAVQYKEFWQETIRDLHEVMELNGRYRAASDNYIKTLEEITEQQKATIGHLKATINGEELT